MPLTTNYVHYRQADVCNIVASGSCNLAPLDSVKCAVGAAENVHVYNLRTGVKVSTFAGSSPCTQLVADNARERLAVGHRNGQIRVYKRTSEEDNLGQKVDQPTLVFDAHRTSVSSLAFAPTTGLTLVSGGHDCAVIIWDLVGESGVVKLLGHKGPVTRVLFTQNEQFVISSSKDTFIKLWSVASRSCFYTIADHKTEIYDIGLFSDDTRLVCGSGELELRVYGLSWKQQMLVDEPAQANMAAIGSADDDSQQCNIFVNVSLAGSLMRNTKGRTHQLCVSPDQRLIVAVVSNGANNSFDIFRIYTNEEATKRINKKIKHAQKQLAAGTQLTPETESAIRADFSAYVQRITSHKCSDKIKSISFGAGGRGAVDDYRLLAVLGNNSIECLGLNMTKADGGNNIDFDKLECACNQLGHRTDVRTCAFSADSTALLTASKDSVKIWNRDTLACVLTMPCQEAVSSAFIVADNYCLIGNKQGVLTIYNSSSGQICDELTEKHSGAINAISLSTDVKQCLTASTDKTIKFWDFEQKFAASGAKYMSLKQRRSLQLPDEALCAKWSGKYLVAGLLNTNALVFFTDSLKLFLTLHGHSLPVLCVDVSHDEKLVITGSADKNVKIWGLDFGDCRKSIFAHDDSVTCVKFVPNSLLFFTAGKDGVIKQWDASNFEQIQVLKGHTDQIWALSLSPDGRRMVSASHDRTVRLWHKTDELLVLQEQQEMEREEEFEAQMADAVDVIPGESSTDAIALASKRSLLSVKSIEEVIDAIEIVRVERQALIDKDPLHKRHPLLEAMQVDDLDRFVADVFRKIRSTDVERALLMLPQSMLLDVLQSMNACIKQTYHMHLCTRVILFLCRVFYHHLVNDPKAQLVIATLRTQVIEKITESQETVGFNLAALRLLKWELEERQDVQVFLESNEKASKKQKKQKKKVQREISDRMLRDV